MKLLYCNECGSIFNLHKYEKQCTCGKTKGRYTDNLYAVYSGPCVPLGFLNGSFVEAVKGQPMKGMGKDFKAFVIPHICDTFVEEKDD